MTEKVKAKEEQAKRLMNSVDSLIDCCVDVARELTEKSGDNGVSTAILDNLVLDIVADTIDRYKERVEKSEREGKIIEELPYQFLAVDPTDKKTSGLVK